MVELECSVLSVGMVVGWPGSPWCRQPVGRRFSFDPCIFGWFDVGQLSCCLFMVASLLPQLYGCCMVVLAALWSACSSLGVFCCWRRCRILGCRVDDAGAVGCFVRRSACAQPVMVSRCGRHVGCGVRCAPTGVWPARRRGLPSLWPHAVGVSGVALLPALVWPAMSSSCMDVMLSCCLHRYAWPVLLRRLRRLMAGLSCCRVCWAMVAIGGRLRLCGGARTPSCWGVLRCCMTPLLVKRCVGVCPSSWWGVVWWCVAPNAGAWCGRVWLPAWWAVLRWCVAALMVGRVVVLCDPLHGKACCVVVLVVLAALWSASSSLGFL